MTLEEFIQEYHRQIDTVILTAVPNSGPIDNEERRLWILNDPGLYSWARSEGVDI